MAKTVVFVGAFRKAYLDYFINNGYIIGWFADKESLEYKRMYEDKDPKVFNQFLFIIPIDFSSRKNILKSISGFHFEENTLLYNFFDRYTIATAYIADYVKLKQSKTLSISLARNATDKVFQRKVFAEKHPEITPHFRRISNFHSAYTFVRKYGFPVIVKPSGLSQSQLVNVCTNLEELIQKVSYVLDHVGEVYKQNRVTRAPKVIIEQYIRGQQYSVDSYVDHDGNIIHTPICTQVIGYDIGENNFETLYSTYTDDLNQAQKEIIFNTVSKSIQSLNVKGNPTHTEVRLSEDGICKVVEVNVRTGGFRAAMLHHSYEIDHVSNAIRTYLNEPVEIKHHLVSHTSSPQFWAKKEGSLLSIEGLDELKKLPSYKYLHINFKNGDLVGPADFGFQRLLFVILSHRDKDQLYKDIESARELIEIRVRPLNKVIDDEYSF
jgi:S-sulfo-L-cysteine synthase (3-phospho-L-serine-dependent)